MREKHSPEQKPNLKKQPTSKDRKEILKQIDDHLTNIQLSESQKKYSETIKNNTITFCHGPAGTSKTFTACVTSLELLVKHKVNKVVLCKPIQESGEKLGFLPGEVSDKIGPFMESYVSNYIKILGEPLFKIFESMFLEYRPLAYMRGASFDECLMILDEVQNADFSQLILFVTRLGNRSKMLACGDVSQFDIEKKKVALPKFIELMDGIEGVSKFIFNENDIVRNKILIEITQRYERWKHNDKS